MASQNLDDVRKQAEFDRLMASAQVNRMRGDYGQATNIIRQALDLNPSNLKAREFAADMLFAHGKLEKAIEEYKSILNEDKSLASVEEKYAKAILQIAEGKRQQELLQDMLDNPNKHRTPERSPLIAAMLSIAPGFGQIYCGQLIKGIVLFLATMLSWLLSYAFAPPIASNLPAQDRIMDFVKNMSAPAVLFICIATFIQIYALVDAPVAAGKTKEKSSSEPE